MDNVTISSQRSVYSPGNDSGSDASETSSGVCFRRHKLNKFLSTCGVDEVKQPKKLFSCLNVRTQHIHLSKASESIVAVLEVIAPGDAAALWEALKRSKLVEYAIPVEDIDQADKVYLEALAETYQHAVGWDTRRQVLSIMADLVPFSTIQQYLPGITRYRVKSARHHKLLHGRGAPVPITRCTRMRISPTQLDHFLTFITSPHVIQDLPFGQRYLSLSHGKILETPNVIRTMINQRIVDQYSQFCSEAHFKPFSPSTMQRILSSCSATVRKSLQGLDYIAAEGTKAFDDLTYIAGKLVDHGVDRQTGTGLEKSFKEGKQYLKTDYKVQ